MIEEFRELFATLYQTACEHEQYAYALSDDLNEEVDNAMLKAFRSDLGNLMSRCELVTKTEQYALDCMKKRRIPVRRFVWYKLRRISNPSARAIEQAVFDFKDMFERGAVRQTSRLELEIASAQGILPEDPSSLYAGSDGSLPDVPEQTYRLRGDPWDDPAFLWRFVWYKTHGMSVRSMKKIERIFLATDDDRRWARSESEAIRTSLLQMRGETGVGPAETPQKEAQRAGQAAETGTNDGRAEGAGEVENDGELWDDGGFDGDVFT